MSSRKSVALFLAAVVVVLSLTVKRETFTGLFAKGSGAPNSRTPNTGAAGEARGVPQSSLALGPAPGLEPTPTDLKQLDILKQIFAKKNDNDPRLDRDLRHLSPAAKALLRAEYASLTPESRNERGTIVFLLGRDLNSSSDAEFISKVLSEPECLSLARCSESPPPAKRDDEHIETANEVTLVYPQLMALSPCLFCAS